MFLVGQLHLHDELLPALVLAHHIKPCVPVPSGQSELLGRQVGDVLNPLVREYLRQERDKELLVHLRPEEPFESPIVQRVDVPWQSITLHIHFVTESGSFIFQKCAVPSEGTQVIISNNSHKDNSFSWLNKLLVPFLWSFLPGDHSLSCEGHNGSRHKGIIVSKTFFFFFGGGGGKNMFFMNIICFLLSIPLL